MRGFFVALPKKAVRVQYPLMFNDLSKLLESPARLKLIKFFSFQPNQRFSVRDVSATLGIGRKKTEVELRYLVRARLVFKKGRGGNAGYEYNNEHPLGHALNAFLADATIPPDKMIARAFVGIPGLSLIVSCGVLTLDMRSSVDLLIVAKRPKNQKIERAVAKVEALVALPLRYAVLESSQYKGRLEANDRLLRDVFDFRHRIIRGRP